MTRGEGLANERVGVRCPHQNLRSVLLQLVERGHLEGRLCAEESAAVAEGRVDASADDTGNRL
jgi:hypothetical protein